jgi:hypothetical protein
MKRNYLTGGLVIAVIVLSILLFRSCDKKHEAPTQLITAELAKNLNQNYITLRSPLIEQNINRIDANAAWYSIEELENYLHYAKSEAEKSHKEISGVRFYLGVYPNDPATYQEKAGLTTVFLSPTVKRDPYVLKPQRFQPAVAAEENIDAAGIQPLNYGGMGHPPRITYPAQ